MIPLSLETVINAHEQPDLWWMQPGKLTPCQPRSVNLSDTETESELYLCNIVFNLQLRGDKQKVDNIKSGIRYHWTCMKLKYLKPYTNQPRQRPTCFSSRLSSPVTVGAGLQCQSLRSLDRKLPRDLEIWRTARKGQWQQVVCWRFCRMDSWY